MRKAVPACRVMIKSRGPHLPGEIASRKGSTACGGGSNEGVHALEGCMSYYVLRSSRIGTRKNMKARGWHGCALAGGRNLDVSSGR